MWSSNADLPSTCSLELHCVEHSVTCHYDSVPNKDFVVTESCSAGPFLAACARQEKGSGEGSLTPYKVYRCSDKRADGGSKQKGGITFSKVGWGHWK